MGSIKFTISMIMIALFSIAIITFAINFASDNNAAITIDDDSSYSSLDSGMQSDVNEFYSGSSTAFDSFQSSTVQSQTESSEGGTQFKVTPTTALSMSSRAITTGWNKIFGSDSEFSVIFTALIAIFGFVIALYAWKAWKGNPD